MSFKFQNVPSFWDSFDPCTGASICVWCLLQFLWLTLFVTCSVSYENSLKKTVPALELLIRAVPSVIGYHHRSVGPTTGINPGGRQKKKHEEIFWGNILSREIGGQKLRGRNTLLLRGGVNVLSMTGSFCCSACKNKWSCYQHRYLWILVVIAVCIGGSLNTFTFLHLYLAQKSFDIKAKSFW